MRILIQSEGQSYYGVIAVGVLQTMDKTLTVCTDALADHTILNSMVEVGIAAYELTYSCPNWMNENWDYQILISSEKNHVFPLINGKTRYRIVLPIKIASSDNVEQIRDIIGMRISDFYQNSVLSQFDYSQCKCCK